MTDPTPAPSLEPPRLPWWAVLLPSLLALLLFAPVWSAGFVYDDIDLLERNPTLGEWSTILEAFRRPFWELAGFEQSNTGYYRPVGATAFVLLHKLGGGDAQAYHLASTLFHAASAALVVLLALGLRVPRWAALLAGLVFACSGTHVEAVAWASALPDLLATFFSLIALNFWVRGRGLLALPALLLAMLSKEAAYATWLLLVGVTLLRSKTLLLPRVPIAALTLILTAALVYFARWQAFDSLAAGFDKQITHAFLDPTHERLLATGLVARYLGFLLLPLESRPFRPLELDVVPRSWELGGIGGIGIAAMLFALVIWLLRGRRSPTILIGLGLTFAALAPVLNPSAIGRFPFEERFAYLSSAGFAIVFAVVLCWLLQRTADRLPLRAGLGVLALAWFGLNVTTVARTVPHWQDNETFARWATEVSPETMTPWLLAGQATLQRAQQLPPGSKQRSDVADEAFDFFQRSLEVNVDDVLVAAHEREAGNVGQGDALYTGGDLRVAEQVYQKTLEGYPLAQFAHLGLSNIYLTRADEIFQRSAQLKDPQARRQAEIELLGFAEMALTHSSQSLQGEIRLPAMYFNRSMAHYWKGLLQDRAALTAAEADARRANAMEPTSFEYVLHLLEVLYLRNEPEQMAKVLEAYLQAVPNAPDRAELEQQIATLRANS